MNKLKAVIISIIYDYIYIPIYFKIVYFRDWKKIKAIFGEFEKMNKADLKKYCLNFKGKTANVTGLLIGEIVKIVLDLKLEPEKVLLDGDNKTAVNQVREKFNFKKAAIVTVGKEGEFDYIWDFENDCPQNMPRDFDLIISQAMFEHLINPFKHLEDLSKLLIRGGGYLVIHSAMPGYTYHRYPIDTVRFFPDWFELAGQKVGLKVKRKFSRDFHIIYLFEKV